MDQVLTALFTPLIGLFGSVVISLFGLVLGGAARYGLPLPFRRIGGWLLAGLGVALTIIVIVGISLDRAGHGGWRFAAILTVWSPGFVAASLGAGRWTMAASVAAGMVLSYVIAASFIGAV
jgi:hypothetical protein